MNPIPKDIFQKQNCPYTPVVCCGSIQYSTSASRKSPPPPPLLKGALESKPFELKTKRTIVLCHLISTRTTSHRSQGRGKICINLSSDYNMFISSPPPLPLDSQRSFFFHFLNRMIFRVEPPPRGWGRCSRRRAEPRVRHVADGASSWIALHNPAVEGRVYLY